jgi:superfamily II DNA or RNA helicase
MAEVPTGPLMPTLSIRPKDNVHVFVTSDNEGILHDLQDYLTFFVEGYRHQAKFKFGGWDGKIRLYSPHKRTVYRGLIPRICQWATDMNYGVDIAPELKTPPTVSPQQIADFVDTLDLSRDDDGKRVDLKPYTFQWLGIYHAINDKRRVFEASTAGGKSLIAYILCRWFMAHQENPKVLLVTDTVNLVAQMRADFKDYAGKTDWIMEDHVHPIFSGQEKTTDHEVYVSTWASMAKQPKSYFKQFTAIIIDEAHKVKSKSFQNILERCDLEYKIGMTGTLYDSLTHRYVTEGLLGESMVLLTSAGGRELGITADVKVDGIVFEYGDEEKKALSKLNYISPAEKKAGKRDKSYNNELEFLIKHPKRNAKMCEFIAAAPGNSVALFARIEHGMELMAIIKKQHPDRKLYFISGDVVADDRERLRHILKTETNAIVIASFGVFSTGVNIPALHNLFICSPTKSMIRLMQSLGRIGRKHKTKGIGRVFHFGDDLRLPRKNAKDNHTLKHFIQCVKKYDKEQIDYTLTNMRL